MKAKARPPHHPARQFSPLAFFERWPVFTIGAFRAEHAKTHVTAGTTMMLLRAHVEAGHLVRLRRGLFAVPGAVDPYVVASLLTPDSVLAYGAALSFHGLVQATDGMPFLSFFRCRPFLLDEVGYQAVRPAQSLKRSRALVDGVEQHKHNGRMLRVTSKERTLVDALDRLDLVPSLWVVVQAFIGGRRLDVGAMVRHAKALGHALTAARLGHIIETLGRATEAQLRQLEALSPRSPVYFDTATRSEPSHFERRWQLVVPHWLPNALRGQLDFGSSGPPSRAP